MRGLLVFSVLVVATARADAAPGTIELELRNYHPKQRAHYVSATAYGSYETRHTQPTPEGRCVIADLAPAKYLVEIYTLNPEQVLGCETVEVASGKVTRVAITLDDLLDPELRVPLEGVLEIPAEWGKVEVGLGLAGMRVPEWAAYPRPEVKLAGGRWSCRVVPGIWTIEVRPLTYQVAVTVGREGLRDVRIAVPAPVDVTLRAIDADSGREASLRELNWYAKRPDPRPPRTPDEPLHRGWGLVQSGVWNVAVRQADGTYRFRAPAGELTLVPPSHAGYYMIESVHEVGPHRNELKVTLQRECGFDVKVNDRIDLRDERFWNPSGLDLSIDGKGEMYSYLIGPPSDRRKPDEAPHEVRVYLTRTGKYRVASGALGLPAQDILVKPGEFVQLRGH